jgi:4-amino-4-deoxy-L-arabinose transferase-like glycosyltransferase
MKLRDVAVLSTLALLAVLVSLYTTSTGTGLAPDSYFYIASARSLLGGEGLRIPQEAGWASSTAHFPPLYAVLLALSSLSVFDPLETARWLNALLFGANFFLVGYTILRLTGGSWLAAYLGALVTLSSGDLLLIHAHAWSEPAFFFFSLLGMLWLAMYVTDQRLGLLVGAATATGLACLTRYAGIALVAAGIVSLLWFAGLSRREKIRSAARFLGISATPIGLWALYNLLLAGSLADRVLGKHPIGLRELARGAETIAYWAVPAGATGIIHDILALAVPLGGATLLGAYLLRSYRFHRTPPGGRNERASAIPFALFTLIYAAFLLVSISFFDAQTGLDARILSPVFITCLVLAAAGLARGLPRARVGIRWLGMALVLGLVGAYLSSGYTTVQGLYAGEGKGYSGPYWTQSKLLQQLRGYPASIPVYSNGSDVIYLLTGRPAIGLPREVSPNSLRVNPAFEDEMREMRKALEEQGGILVYFYELAERRRYLPTEYELNEMLPLERITRWSKEGVLYRIKQ